MLLSLHFILYVALNLNKYLFSFTIIIQIFSNSKYNCIINLSLFSLHLIKAQHECSTLEFYLNTLVIRDSFNPEYLLGKIICWFLMITGLLNKSFISIKSSGTLQLQMNARISDASCVANVKVNSSRSIRHQF